MVGSGRRGGVNISERGVGRLDQGRRGDRDGGGGGGGGVAACNSSPFPEWD